MVLLTRVDTADHAEANVGGDPRWMVMQRPRSAPLHAPPAQQQQQQRPVSAQAACHAPAETSAQIAAQDQLTAPRETLPASAFRESSEACLQGYREVECREDWCREVRWLPELTARHTVSDDGRALTRLAAGRTTAGAWASGPLLPTFGSSSWCIRINKSLSGGMVLGVQDAAGRNGWGLNPGAGTLWRHSRDADGFVGTVLPAEGSGWPDANGSHVLKDADGNCSNLCGKAEGAVIEVHVDHDAGSLSFRVDYGPMQLASCCFPPAASLRPWARLYHGVHDRVTLVPPLAGRWESQPVTQPEPAKRGVAEWRSIWRQAERT